MKKISKYILIAGCLLGASGFAFFFWQRAQAPVPAAPPFPAPTSGTIRIVAFGDSLTAGYNLPLDQAYPAVLERFLRARGFAVEVINSGVSGETSAGGVRRAEFIRNLAPALVLFGLGGNDALRFLSPAELEKNLRDALTTLLAGERPPRVLLLGMRAPGNSDAAYRAAFDAVYLRLARDFSLPLVPFFLEGVALDPRFTLPDGIHPNQTGYEYIVERTVGPAVIPVLEGIKRSQP